jgi:hypothetical protein
MVEEDGRWTRERCGLSGCVCSKWAGASGASRVKRTSEKAEKVVTARDVNGTAAGIADWGCESIKECERMRGGV